MRRGQDPLPGWMLPEHITHFLYKMRRAISQVVFELNSGFFPVQTGTRWNKLFFSMPKGMLNYFRIHNLNFIWRWKNNFWRHKKKSVFCLRFLHWKIVFIYFFDFIFGRFFSKKSKEKNQNLLFFYTITKKHYFLEHFFDETKNWKKNTKKCQILHFFLQNHKKTMLFRAFFEKKILPFFWQNSATILQLCRQKSGQRFFFSFQ